MKRTIIFLALSSFLFSCKEQTETKVLESAVGIRQDKQVDKKLNSQWYEGKAEISTYELKQNRYSGVHSGEATMIFVTEDFLTDKQVKNDNYTSDKSTAILKNNQIRRFSTGIYDYSIFTSVFTEFSNNLNTLKITSSSQDWCGQSFMQINKLGNDYRINTQSYFENEGDKITSIKKHLIIDEVFNIIRINIDELKIGNIKCIPSTSMMLLKHYDKESYDAKAILLDYEGPLTKHKAKMYVIKIPELNLTYEFLYNESPLKEIIYWSETFPSAFDKKIRKTEAHLKARKWIDYWNKNRTSDAPLRDSLKLMK